MSRALPACTFVAEALLNGLPVGWRTHLSQYGTASLVLDAEDARLEVVLWSMKDPVPTKPGTVDTLQVELVARLNWIEEFLVRHFGELFTNEQGKTVSMFLHRVVPYGRKYASGVDVTLSRDGPHPSVECLARLILDQGLPFLDRVRSGATLLDGEGINPRLVDPANWEVRRALAILAKSDEADPEIVLSDAENRVERGLTDKFMAMASIVSTIDPDAEISTRLARFQTFKAHVLSSPDLLYDIQYFRVPIGKEKQ